jgi:hypothetical protein
VRAFSQWGTPPSTRKIVLVLLGLALSTVLVFAVLAGILYAVGVF